MEEASPVLSSSKITASASFRLRCPSLNSVRLRRIFDLFDKNCDGVITVQELSQALSILGLEADLSELDSTVRFFIQPGSEGLRFEDFSALHHFLNITYFDKPGNGGDEQEIVDSTAAKLSQEDSDLSEAFKVFDEDGDGYISPKELQAVLSKLGFLEGSEIEKCEKMIISVDINHDGRVDFLEFKDMMRSVIVRSC